MYRELRRTVRQDKNELTSDSQTQKHQEGKIGPARPPNMRLKFEEEDGQRRETRDSITSFISPPCLFFPFLYLPLFPLFKFAN